MYHWYIHWQIEGLLAPAGSSMPLRRVCKVPYWPKITVFGVNSEQIPVVKLFSFFGDVPRYPQQPRPQAGEGPLKTIVFSRSGRWPRSVVAPQVRIQSVCGVVGSTGRCHGTEHRAPSAVILASNFPRIRVTRAMLPELLACR